IEDFGVVEAVREAYHGRLTLVPTLLQAAQAKGLTTAAVGKFGAAFIQDYRRGGIILDEDSAMPLAFAKELQNAGYALPRNSANAHPAGALTLAKDKLRQLGWEQSTDIIITQDHNHSTVSGDVGHFPLRDIADGGAGVSWCSLVSAPAKTFSRNQEQFLTCDACQHQPYRQ